MNPEQIEELRKAIVAVTDACKEAECLISDYMKCESEVSKKYLGAAIKKHASAISSNFKPELFN